MLSTLKKYAELARLPNLLIVVLTVWWPSYHIFQVSEWMGGRLPAYYENSGLQWLTAVIVMSTFSGYIINAIFDREIDAINKPFSASVVHFSVRQLWILYGLGLLSVAVAAVFFFKEMSINKHLWALPIFVGVNVLLFLYSWKWKCRPVLGNIVVSLLCALVPFCVILAAYEGQFWGIVSAEWLMLLVMFAFFATFMREVVKDIEDLKGDRKAGCMTFVQGVGTESSKIFVYMLSGFELLGFAWFSITMGDMEAFLSFVLRDWWQLLLIFIPLFVALYFLEKSQFSKASLWLKLHMLAGILMVPLFG